MVPPGNEEQGLLDAIPASVAVIGADGAIRAVNRGWREFATANGRPGAGTDVGWSYATWLDSVDPDAAEASAGVLAVISGMEEQFSFVYPCHAPDEDRWFQFLVVPLEPLAPRSVLTLHLRVGSDVFDRLANLAERTLQWLDGVVTLCAWCKARERDVDGTWVPIDPGAPVPELVSHGICPSCLASFEVPASPV